MPDKNGWARVEDALPELEAEVWAWRPIPGSSTRPGESVGEFLDATFWGAGWSSDGLRNIHGITHWQSQKYPEPPEDE